MFRRGKAEGWLQLPPSALLPWAMLNDVTFNRTVPGVVAGKGGALLAKEDLDADSDASRILLTVPRDLILSLERVQDHAKADRDFREVLDALGDFGRTPRGAILCFLVVQGSMSCPHFSNRFGVHSAFTDYIKSLPLELLPTTWTPAELQLLIGTTLASAMSAKFKSLQREYDLLCTAALDTRWYQIVEDQLEFDDWLQVDAMYRSRALDYPDIGHCMVPCADVANHATGEDTVALYEKDPDGNAILLLRDGQKVKDDNEITITYGDEKGACEMLFSYGFIDEGMTSAGTLFLSLGIPDSDTCRSGKIRMADCAPGFKLSETEDGKVEWTNDFVWLLCVTSDDDFRFEVARTVAGEEDMQAFFQDQEITGGAAELHSLLNKSEMWDVYRLRAVSILQQRVFDQMQLLYSTQNDMEAEPYGQGTEIRPGPYQNAMRLRQLEFGLLETAYQSFEDEKTELIESPVVARYLARMNREEPNDSTQAEDDFS